MMVAGELMIDGGVGGVGGGSECRSANNIKTTWPPEGQFKNTNIAYCRVWFHRNVGFYS